MRGGVGWADLRGTRPNNQQVQTACKGLLVLCLLYGLGIQYKGTHNTVFARKAERRPVDNKYKITYSL